LRSSRSFLFFCPSGPSQLFFFWGWSDRICRLGTRYCVWGSIPCVSWWVYSCGVFWGLRVAGWGGARHGWGSHCGAGGGAGFLGGFARGVLCGFGVGSLGGVFREGGVGRFGGVVLMGRVVSGCFCLLCLCGVHLVMGSAGPGGGGLIVGLLCGDSVVLMARAPGCLVRCDFFYSVALGFGVVLGGLVWLSAFLLGLDGGVGLSLRVVALSGGWVLCSCPPVGFWFCGGPWPYFCVGFCVGFGPRFGFLGVVCSVVSGGVAPLLVFFFCLLWAFWFFLGLFCVVGGVQGFDNRENLLLPHPSFRLPAFEHFFGPPEFCLFFIVSFEFPVTPLGAEALVSRGTGVLRSPSSTFSSPHPPF